MATKIATILMTGTQSLVHLNQFVTGYSFSKSSESCDIGQSVVFDKDTILRSENKISNL